MGNATVLIVRVQTLPDGDDDEVAELTQRLRTQLLDLDVNSVDPVADASIPEGAKGLEVLTGWLAVQLGKETLRRVVGTVVSWATRTGHNVEVSINGDTLKVSGVTSAQQEKIIDMYLAQHTQAHKTTES